MLRSVCAFFLSLKVALAAVCLSLMVGPLAAQKKDETIVFTVRPVDKREPGGRGLQIHRVNADGKGLKALADKEEITSDPALAPDGRRVAFIVMNEDRTTSLCVMNLDGTGRKEIAKKEESIVAPRWSPNGKHIAFGTARFGFKDPSFKPRLYLIDPEGKNLKPLAKLNGMMPSWSPDGKRLLFMREEGMGRAAPSLCAVNVDETNLTVLVKDGPAMGSWSPDGQWLAYVIVPSLHTRAEAAGLYLAKADGTRAKRLIGSKDRFVFGAEWSADSKRILYTELSMKSGPGDNGKEDALHATPPFIHILEIESGKTRRLTSGTDPEFIGGSYFLAVFLFR